MPQVKVLPWLVFSHYEQCGVYNFVDPANCSGEKNLMNFSELLFDAKILFLKGSWLLMSQGGSNIFFFNPFTREIIQFPDLPHSCTFWGICFSTSPTSLDCVVFAIAGWTKFEVEIWFIARGGDCWHHSKYENPKLTSEEGMVLDSSLNKYLEFNPSKLSNPVFYNGSFIV
ncbi:hypothetical protein MKX01_003430 [Papaver californicum]|nr:hypothetical protein MKX01_003430 [Papaver californicum]